MTFAEENLFYWHGKLGLVTEKSDEEQVSSLIHVSDRAIYVRVWDGESHWFGEGIYQVYTATDFKLMELGIYKGHEDNLVTSVKLTSSILEAVASALNGDATDTKLFLKRNTSSEGQVSLSLQIFRVLESSLPVQIGQLELKQDSGGLNSFVESIFDLLTLVMREKKESEERLEKEKLINSQLHVALETTRQDKNTLEQRLFNQFVLLLNEKKRKIAELMSRQAE